ncbi:cell division protein FtsQ/DivIB [Ruania alba]|uniref:Cell division protein FtsQ n=1 Tax=Ruania alba TaxID=648782 RepID=A0A1H5EA05_9MICO|nr:FtsQ-type POTRA domain-containing protein [Ruania alba]SED87973.1 cell division protein FtsQ [Ruania alba]
MRAPAQPRGRGARPSDSAASGQATAAPRSTTAVAGRPASARPPAKEARATQKEQGRAARRADREQRRAERQQRREVAAAEKDAQRGRGAQLSERIAERRAAVRRLRWRAIGATIAAIGVLAGLGWVAFASPVLTVHADDVDVSGTSDYVREERVQEIAAMAHDVPLARVDTAALAEEIRALAAVRDVQVRRAWPNGLAVVLEPRVPVATVSDGDRYALLDAEAVVMARRDDPVEGVPEVTVPLQDPATAESLTAVLTVLAALPEDLRADVASAGAETPYQVRLELAGGAEVVWGSAEENALKVEVLQTLRQVEASGYDVSAPRSPITTE